MTAVNIVILGLAFPGLLPGTHAQPRHRRDLQVKPESREAGGRSF